MSVEAMAIVLHHSKAKGTDKVILLGIANHAGDGGAWPKLETLARYANVGEDAARAALRRLERSGELHTHLNAGGDLRKPSWLRPNRYDVMVACPITCDRTMNHRPMKLPSAPADLWIDPPPSTGGPLVRGASDPLATGGDPPPSTGAEPSIEPPDNNQGPASTTGQAPASTAPCSVCGKCEVECQRRATISGHDYTPPRRDA